MIYDDRNRGSQRNGGRSFDPSAFRVPEPGRFGSSAMNVIQGQGVNLHHLTVSKQFMIAERFKLVYTGAISNLANPPHFPGMRTNIPVAGAGQLTSLGGRLAPERPSHRHANLQLRLEFRQRAVAIMAVRVAMIETKAQPDSRVILNDVSWRLYTDLLSEVGESPGTRITYDGGRLQIMVVSAGHDNPNRTIAEIVSFACLETGIDYCPLGSTTFKREDLLKGFEPDSCFYFANAELVRGLEEIDLAIHPPPELVIEIDITSDSMNKLPIFAAVGVAEVWRYTRSQVEIFVLDGPGYRSDDRSSVLPALTATAISQLAESSRRMKRLAWVQSVRDRILEG